MAHKLPISTALGALVTAPLILGTFAPAYAATITINEGNAESGTLRFNPPDINPPSPEFSDLNALIAAGVCTPDRIINCRTFDGEDTIILERVGFGGQQFIQLTWTSDIGDFSPAETGESFTTGASAGLPSSTFIFNSAAEVPVPNVGLPGLILAMSGLLWWRRRKIASLALHRWRIRIFDLQPKRRTSRAVRRAKELFALSPRKV